MHVIALLALILMVPKAAYAYIDPGTTTTVLSGLGAILAALATAGMFVVLLLRRFFKAIGVAIWTAFRFGFGTPKGIMVVAATASAMALIFYLLQSDLNMVHGNGKRVIVLGFDGMDPRVAQQFMDEGELPNFAQLAQRGDFKPLQTVNPVESPVVWTTMATGANPSVHKITDFIKRKGKDYSPTLSLTKTSSGKFDALTGKVFDPPVKPSLFVWDRLANAGVPVSVMRWPMTFPPQGDGMYLAGLGTPDLLGNMGRYTLLTEDAEEFNPSLKGNVVPLDFEMEGASSTVELSGPTVSGFMENSDSQTRFTVTKETEKVVIATAERKVALEIGQLSPWMKLSFDGGMGKSISGIVQFMVLNQDPVHIYMSPIQIDPTNPLYPVTNPPGLAKTLAGKFGFYHTLGLAEDTNALVDEVIDEDQFLQMSERVMLEAENIFFDQLATRKTGLVGYVFDTVDRVCHVFWRYRDHTHPAHNEVQAIEYANVIKRFYQKADAIVGRVMAQMDPDRDTLLIVSDHGFSSYRRSVHLNAWLTEQGYMVLKDGFQEVGPLFDGVDWSQTKAFALGFSQIYFNVKGRDPNGIVSPGEVDILRHEISNGLLAMADDFEGVAPVDKVFSAEEAFGAGLPYGPEMVVGLKPGYRFSWQTAMGAAPTYVFEDNLKAWSGDHIINATHVPGIIFSSRSLGVDQPSVYDIAPTVMKLFGLEKEPQMSGKNLFPANPS